MKEAETAVTGCSSTGIEPLEIADVNKRDSRRSRRRKKNAVGDGDGLFREESSPTAGGQDADNAAVLESSLAAQQEKSSSDFWLTIAGVAGNVLEWYDFGKCPPPASFVFIFSFMRQSSLP